MHRWFDIKATEEDLGFEPIIGFRDDWDETKLWCWLPTFNKDMSLMGIANKTQEKIDIQAHKKK